MRVEPPGPGRIPYSTPPPVTPCTRWAGAPWVVCTVACAVACVATQQRDPAPGGGDSSGAVTARGRGRPWPCGSFAPWSRSPRPVRRCEGVRSLRCVPVRLRSASPPCPPSFRSILGSRLPRPAGCEPANLGDPWESAPPPRSRGGAGGLARRLKRCGARSGLVTRLWQRGRGLMACTEPDRDKRWESRVRVAAFWGPASVPPGRTAPARRAPERHSSKECSGAGRPGTRALAHDPVTKPQARLPRPRRQFGCAPAFPAPAARAAAPVPACCSWSRSAAWHTLKAAPHDARRTAPGSVSAHPPDTRSAPRRQRKRTRRGAGPDPGTWAEAQLRA